MKTFRAILKTFRAISRPIALIAFPAFVPKIMARELGFATMEDGDRVEITHASKGCFHDRTLYYEIRRTDGSSIFTQYAITWEKTSPPKIAEKRVVGEIKLTQSDISGLDALLVFFRGKKSGFSTTQDSLLVEYYEGSKRVGTEKLHDESGGHGLEKRKDIIQFSQLVVRIHFFQLVARFKK